MHQVFALTQCPERDHGRRHEQRAAGLGAKCQRYLRDMGVDSQVWVHAMETPTDELFYFKPDELLSLKLATPRPS